MSAANYTYKMHLEAVPFPPKPFNDTRYLPPCQRFPRPLAVLRLWIPDILVEMPE